MYTCVFVYLQRLYLVCVADVVFERMSVAYTAMAAACSDCKRIQVGNEIPDNAQHSFSCFTANEKDGTLFCCPLILPIHVDSISNADTNELETVIQIHVRATIRIYAFFHLCMHAFICSLLMVRIMTQNIHL